MKKILILLILPFMSVCQDTLRYDNLSNKSFFSKIKNYQEFKVYIGKDGKIYKNGMKLIIGKPENPNNISKDLLNNKYTGNFTYIRTTEGYIFTAEKKFSNEEIIIDKIKVIHSGAFKNTPLNTIFCTKLVSKTFLNKDLFVDNIEKAIELGEIVIDSEKEKAIKILEEKKKLLDLGVISIEEYEKIKKELTPIILNFEK